MRPNPLWALLLIAGCASAPTVPTTVNKIEATHDAGDGPKPLEIDEGKLMSCLQSAKSIGIGQAQKCQLSDGDYSVTLNGGETVITVHTSTQFTIDDQGFFEGACLYSMLHQAAHGKAPESGGC